MSRCVLVSALLVCLLGAQTDSSKPPDPARSESLLLKPERTIEFTTDEATWMSINISPDGRSLLVDLLGDLCTVAADGGTLTTQ